MVQPWSEVRVESWDELQRELHTETLVPTCPGEGGHRRSSCMFRGMADESWPLKSSLERHWPQGEFVEGPSRRAFGEYASAGRLSQ